MFLIKCIDIIIMVHCIECGCATYIIILSLYVTEGLLYSQIHRQVINNIICVLMNDRESQRVLYKKVSQCLACIYNSASLNL